MSMNENTRAVMGGNLGNDAPDFAKMEVDRLSKDYALLREETVPQLRAEADAIKALGAIPDNDVKGKVTSLLKRGRDAARRILAFLEVEKQEPYRRGQGVDQFFFGLHDMITKRDKKANDGFLDELQRMLTDYDTRILAEENERRRLAAEEAARVERVARETREKAEREQREREAEAARARAPAKVEEKSAAAQQAAAAASTARVEEAVATSAAQETHIQTLARPADIMRQRGADGTLSTMGQEPFAEIIDRRQFDLDTWTKIGPYLPLPALQSALNGYARSVGHSSDESVQVKGARFGKRPKSIVR